jgi:hypothetical protein
MGGQTSVFPESIDEVLTAVQETPRGRWFLEAYANRIKSDGNSNVLQAIAKLENSLSSIAAGGADSAVLNKARKAIATARQDIVAFDPSIKELSAEGQLFAKLANLSRESFSTTAATAPNIGKGIERALKLVADLDVELSGNATSNAEPAGPKPATQYFRQDEEIFEPVRPAAIVAVVKTPEPPEVPNRGAKLVIQRTSAPKTAEPRPAAVAEPETEKPVQETIAKVPSPDAQEKPQSPSRIVIIRKKAEEMMDVPLLDERENEAASAA